MLSWLAGRPQLCMRGTASPSTMTTFCATWRIGMRRSSKPSRPLMDG